MCQWLATVQQFNKQPAAIARQASYMLHTNDKHSTLFSHLNAPNAASL